MSTHALQQLELNVLNQYMRDYLVFRLRHKTSLIEVSVHI